MKKTCYFLVLLLTFPMPFPAEASTSLAIATDQSALAALKAHITSDPHRILTRNWTINSSSSACSWIGVTCGLRRRRVTALNLSGMSLGGTIPPQLANISFLVSLDLGFNVFSGALPPELSLLHRLKFVSIGVNNFMGDIPSWFGLLPKLEHLSLRNNSFTGSIPNTLSNLSNLQFLDFSFNSLQGRIPEDMGRLQNLQILMMGNNHLSGAIPSSIFNISTLKALALASNEFFSGNLPNEMCDNLPFLERIQLSWNHLSGPIPSTISRCSQLKDLSLSYNSFSGHIPAAIGNLKALQILHLGNNYFNGVIPTEIGQLHKLEELILEYNGFMGSIPPEILNMSALGILSLTDNVLSGSLPTHLCYGSPSPPLQQLFLNYNNLSGPIPHSISNCSNLRILSLASNNFNGFVPHSLGDLRLLQRLLLFNNNLRTEEASSELTFITSLTNCRSLIQLVIGGNPLDGILPDAVGNLSTSLQFFIAFSCRIKGSIPAHIGNLSNLIKLNLFDNELYGSIPLSFKYLHNLQGLALHTNHLGGPIPEGLCDLQSFYFIYFSRNQFSGPIPECLGNVSTLSHILLDSNKLTSSIPFSLWRLRDLVELDLSSNFLTGSLPPEIGNLVAAIYINLSMNQLSKSIPSTIGSLQNLHNLSLAHNILQGPIPESMGSMVSLVTLDLSYNNLSGSIPKSLEALQYFDKFNVSFNALSGEIPTGGPFRNFTEESFKANKELCGIPRFHVALCHTIANHRSRWKKVQFPLFILAGFAALIAIVSFAFIVIRYRRKDIKTSRIEISISTGPERISHHDILQATQQLSESNLLGSGSFGSVYRVILSDKRTFAVKVFNLQKKVAAKSFDVECEVLRNVRHRNLTKVICSCSNDDFKALVLEYMPKGNLEQWLYSHNYCLDVMQRLNIMIDVASALEYLHHGYSILPIVHCDVKPSNVLLDDEMVAHVSDFGIAKLLCAGESTVLTNTLATMGYIAPEYGLEGLVSTRCDVYSFGVTLMETFTRKRPSDAMFSGDLSLKSWIENSLVESPSRAIDAILVMNLEKEEVETKVQCVSSLLELALKCTAESPGDRINMKEALAQLLKIKCKFSNLKHTHW